MKLIKFTLLLLTLVSAQGDSLSRVGGFVGGAGLSQARHKKPAVKPPPVVNMANLRIVNGVLYNPPLSQLWSHRSFYVERVRSDALIVRREKNTRTGELEFFLLKNYPAFSSAHDGQLALSFAMETGTINVNGYGTIRILDEGVPYTAASAANLVKKLK